MDRLEHLLTRLGEECAEVIQRASKAKIFTLAEIQPGQQLSNAERLMYEFNDLYAVMEMVIEEGWGTSARLSDLIDRKAIESKKAKVEEFLLLSKKMGTLTE